jgi:hypothetical protein
MSKSLVYTIATTLVLSVAIKTNYSSLLFVSSFNVGSISVVFPASRPSWSRHATYIDMVQETSSSSTEEKPNHPLGPPESLNSMKIDDKALSSSSLSYKNFRYDAFGNVQDFEVTRVSDGPDIFHIRNFVSTMERHTLMWTDRNHPQDAYVYDGEKANNRTNSCVSWMAPNAASGIPAKLARSAAKSLFSTEMKSGKGGSGLYEPLQFVRYNEDGEFLLHHDAHGRVLTVIYYLNGVARSDAAIRSNLMLPLNGLITRGSELMQIQLEVF